MNAQCLSKMVPLRTSRSSPSPSMYTLRLDTKPFVSFKKVLLTLICAAGLHPPPQNERGHHSGKQQA